jgi:hypothetical protein
MNEQVPSLTVPVLPAFPSFPRGAETAADPVPTT